MADEPEQRQRRIEDKRLVDLHVNIPTLAVIILQTFGAAWAASSLFYENGLQTKQLLEVTGRLYQVEKAMAVSQVLESRLMTLESELRFLRVHLDQLSNEKRLR